MKIVLILLFSIFSQAKNGPDINHTLEISQDGPFLVTHANYKCGKHGKHGLCDEMKKTSTKYNLTKPMVREALRDAGYICKPK